MSAERTVLVTGGAGYIGSHTVARLVARGIPVVVVDNLTRGHRWAVPAGVPLVVGDIADVGLVTRTLRRHAVTAVVHFAAASQVGESMQEPRLYYANNVAGTLRLLDAMLGAGVERLVFSSTAAVYGEPARGPIDEDSPRAPTNVYGRTKLVIEDLLADYGAAYGLRYAALRYFNAAGADEGGAIGEDHDPETHLIPLVLRAARTGAPVTVFGTDYPTPDGTCVRDYVHVTDLAEAHVLALEALAGRPALTYNLGNGAGFSVRAVIEAAQQATGRPIPVREGPRRAGDPAVLVASSERIKRELLWQPRLGELGTIIRTAWAWEQRRPGRDAAR
ncbi:MAG TPA: UDP-glucose 4-epimerase GalE [Polyangia bacterium]|jgi:UDP-glucose-4-epimerase GalE